MLRLRVAGNFYQRLLGVYRHGPLARDEGIVLLGCRSIHTFFMSEPIDVVFVDAMGHECASIPHLAPWRIAASWAAQMVIELPCGYCSYHIDYLERIRLALECSGLLMTHGSRSG